MLMSLPIGAGANNNLWQLLKSWLYPLPLKTSASSSVFLVWKGSKQWWNWFFVSIFLQVAAVFAVFSPLSIQKRDLSVPRACTQTDRDAPLMTLSWKVCLNFTAVDLNSSQVAFCMCGLKLVSVHRQVEEFTGRWASSSSFISLSIQLQGVLNQIKSNQMVFYKVNFTHMG